MDTLSYSEISTLLSYSHHATRLLKARPDFVDDLLQLGLAPFTRAEMEQALSPCGDSEIALFKALRELRQRVILRLILRDLSDQAPLSEIVDTTTALAEVTLTKAASIYHARLSERYGLPENSSDISPLMIVGMGKLGGRELNVSSDVDLIFVYPEAGETQGAQRISHQEFFDQVGRKIIAALQEITADGFVFRVDMRLRPYGESGALTLSLAMLEQYFLSQGREWERYAWLKARVLSGGELNDNSDTELDALVQSFVYRKYLDFDAYSSLRDLHQQIRQQVTRRDLHHNIKLGPGGIREIEFIVQIFQLIRGGRDAPLRERNTLQALDRLQQRGILPLEAAAELKEAYHFLRRLEHRLQYRDDQQTHDLPTRDEELQQLAQVMGYSDKHKFMDALALQRARVTQHFEAVFYRNNETQDKPSHQLWPNDTEQSAAEIQALGYSDPAPLLERLKQLRDSSFYAQLPARSKDRLDALLPAVLRAGSGFINSVETFFRLLDLLEAVSRRSSYLALLLEHPALLPRIAKIIAASAWAAAYLTCHPILLDELFDHRLLAAEPDWQAWRSELYEELDAHPGDAERQMDTLRHFQHAQVFRLLTVDLDGRLALERLSDHLSALADLILDAAMRKCWQQIAGQSPEQPRFAIIGYGKLGGKELGYASDLDLVFLYDDKTDPHAAERYARLARRLITWLTATTGAGKLYDIDLRLRPDGESGLMVSSFAAFQHYQHHQAWLWEHQALTRARFCAGDKVLGNLFEAERGAILQQSRDPLKLKQAVLTMREKMHAAHPNRAALFDLKHDPGGMVDIEFIVQYLVLAFSHQHPILTGNLGNIALLKIAGDLALLPAELARKVADAYREFRRLQHALRLKNFDYARVESAAQSERRDSVQQLWRIVFLT